MTTVTNGKATELITFTRGTLATVTDSDGKIKWAAHNLLLASEQFDASSWTKGANVTLTANAAVAPNGTTTADRYSTSSGGDLSANGLSQGLNIGTAIVTGGVWLRSASNQTVQMRLLDGSTQIANQSLSVTSTWTLFTISGANTAGNSTSLVIRPDGTNAISNLEIWGAHLYRSDLGGMQANPSVYPMYNSSTPKNLLGYSEDFSNAAWVKANVTVTADIISAPNGSLTADKIVASNSASTYRSVRQSSSATGRRCISIYARAAEYSLLRVSDYSNGTFYASFNLSDGTVVAGSTGGANFVSAATPVAIGNGWYRISIIVEYTVATSCAFGGYPAGATLDGYGAQYAGDGTSGLYLWGAQLSDSASLDAYSPVFGAAPSAAAYHGPRLDFDPVTLAAKGLLVEEARTNFLTGANFINPASTSGFTASGDAAGVLSVVSDATALAAAGLPIGNVLKIDNSAGTTNYFVRVTNTMTFGAGSWALSAYVRGSGTFIIDVNAGTWTGTTTPSMTSSYQRIVSVGTTNTSSNQMRVRVAAGGVAYVLLMQAEQGAFPTSVIPNTGTEITRNADVASVGVSQFPYSASEGTLVVQSTIRTWSATAYPTHAALNDGTGSNMIILYNINNGATYAEIYTGGNQEFTRSLGTLSDGATTKMAIAYKSDSTQAARDGVASTVDTSTPIPSATRLEIGQYVGGNRLNGWIRQITYLPRRLTSAELAARTA